MEKGSVEMNHKFRPLKTVGCMFHVRLNLIHKKNGSPIRLIHKMDLRDPFYGSNGSVGSQKSAFLPRLLGLLPGTSVAPKCSDATLPTIPSHLILSSLSQQCDLF